jgi:uncharacterized protein (TIGR00369 family)
MSIKKDKINELLNLYLENSTDSDEEVLHSLLEGLILKQNEYSTTYLTSILKMRGELHEDSYIITIPIELLLHNSINIVHGGITATLADTAMGILVNNTVPCDKVAVTSELKMNYLSPGIGKHLRCEAKLIHKGNRTCVTEAKVYSDEEKLVAYSSATFFVLPRV